MYYLEGNPFLHLFMLAYLEPRPHRPSFRKSFNNSEVGEMTGKLSDLATTACRTAAAARSISLPQLGLIAVRTCFKKRGKCYFIYFETSINSLKTCISYVC